MDKDRVANALGITIIVLIILALVTAIGLPMALIASLMPLWAAIVFVVLVVVAGVFCIVYILEG